MGVREERREEGRVVGSKIKKERQGQVMSGRGRKEEEWRGRRRIGGEGGE